MKKLRKVQVSILRNLSDDLLKQLKELISLLQGGEMPLAEAAKKIGTTEQGIKNLLTSVKSPEAKRIKIYPKEEEKGRVYIKLTSSSHGDATFYYIPAFTCRIYQILSLILFIKSK